LHTSVGAGWQLCEFEKGLYLDVNFTKGQDCPYSGLCGPNDLSKSLTLSNTDINLPNQETLLINEATIAVLSTKLSLGSMILTTSILDISGSSVASGSMSIESAKLNISNSTATMDQFYINNGNLTVHDSQLIINGNFTFSNTSIIDLSLQSTISITNKSSCMDLRGKFRIDLTNQNKSSLQNTKFTIIKGNCINNDFDASTQVVVLSTDDPCEKLTSTSEVNTDGISVLFTFENPCLAHSNNENRVTVGISFILTWALILHALLMY